MSLFTLCRMGLLFDETFKILEYLSEKLDWDYAENKLLKSGLSPSKKRTNELKNEIKKRLLTENKNLPNLKDLILINNSRLNLSVKREILYVYLYNRDKNFQKLVDFLVEIFNKQEVAPIITRNEIKKMLEDYKNSNGENPKQKTIANWIGRFIGILKELKILVKKNSNRYIINFGFVNPETFIFFSLYAHFHKVSINNIPLIKSFNLRDDYLDLVIKKINNPSIQFKIYKAEEHISNISITTKYKNINQWVKEINEFRIKRSH